MYLDSDVNSESASMAAAELNGNNGNAITTTPTVAPASVDPPVDGASPSVATAPGSTTSTSDPLRFHEDLKVRCFQCLEEVDKYYLDNIGLLKAQYGVLLFLYSVIASKVRYQNALYTRLTRLPLGCRYKGIEMK